MGFVFRYTHEIISGTSVSVNTPANLSWLSSPYGQSFGASTGASNGYVNIALPAINSWTTFSVGCLWMCPAYTSGTQWLRIIEKGANNEWNLTLSSSANLNKVNFGVGANIGCTSTNAIFDGTWHFLHATYDGTTARLYVDGVLNASGTPSSATGSTNQVYLFQYGGLGSYVTKSQFAGLWVWQNRVLTAQEVSDHFRSPWAMFRAQPAYREYKSILPVGYALTGPTSGVIGQASTAFTLTPNTTVSDTVTMNDVSQGGTFTPSSLTFTSSSTPQTFTYKPLAGGLKAITLVSTNWSITGNPASYTAQPNLVVDNDWGDDVGNVTAFAELYSAAYLGWCNLLSVTEMQSNACALGSSQQRDFYGFHSIPFGRCLIPVISSNWVTDSYVSQVASTYPNSFSGNGANIPDAVEVMRTALAAAPANSVVIMAAGPLTNISNLLNSAANYNSDGLGTGISLIQSAVLFMSCMGGDYPTDSSPEWNFQTDSASAANVFLNFPRPIVSTGFTFGNSIYTGQSLWTSRPSTDFTRFCMQSQNGTNGTERSWDLMSTLFALVGTTYGLLNYFVVNGPGTNVVNSSTGSNTYTLAGSNTGIINYATGTGNHYYLSLGQSGATVLQTAMNNLMVAEPEVVSFMQWLFGDQCGESQG